MMTWVNLLSFALSAIFGVWFYIKSVRPAELEKKIGLQAYARCSSYRITATYLLGISLLTFFLYSAFPLNIQSLNVFFWKKQISWFIGILIIIIASNLFVKGRKAVGLESVVTRKEHQFISTGIYSKIRHPQALGELLYWFGFALLLHSPFLLLIAFLWIPAYSYMSLAEEKDLILRYGQKYIAYMDRTGFFLPKEIVVKSICKRIMGKV